MDNLFLIIVGVFAIIGSIDYAFGNKLGIGEQFAEGFLCMGPTALSMVGIICIIPLLKEIMTPVILPLSSVFGFDPSIVGALLANNMGGYSLATQLASNEQLGLFSGLIVSSMFGATLVYSIPVGLGIVNKAKHAAFAKGIMIGIITIPIGCIVGGLIMGLSIIDCGLNLLPIIVLSIIIILGFKFNEKFVLNCFMGFSKGLNALIIISLGIVAFQSISQIKILSNVDDIYIGLQVVVEMGVAQLGILPLITFIIKIFHNVLEYIGKKMGISAVGTAGLITCCINAISVFTMMNDMDEKDIVIVNSFMVSAICAFTAHLSFTVSVNSSFVIPMILSKLISGIAGVILALIITKKQLKIQNN